MHKKRAIHVRYEYFIELSDQTLFVLVKWKYCFSYKILDSNLWKLVGARGFLVRRVKAFIGKMVS